MGLDWPDTVGNGGGEFLPCLSIDGYEYLWAPVTDTHRH